MIYRCTSCGRWVRPWTDLSDLACICRGDWRTSEDPLEESLDLRLCADCWLGLPAEEYVPEPEDCAARAGGQTPGAASRAALWALLDSVRGGAA